MPTAALPPGPRSALLGGLHYFRDPLGFAGTLARRFGPTFTMGSGPDAVVVTGEPTHIKTVFAADPATFAPFNVEAMTPVLGQGSILLQHGQAHRRARRLLQPPFHGQRMRAYGQAMRDTAVLHVRAMPVGTPLAVEDVFRTISLDVIVRTVFGVAPGPGVEKARQGTLDAVGAFGPLLGLFTFLRRDFGGLGPWAAFRRKLGAVHALLRAEIAARQGAPPTDDVLGMLVATRDEDGAPMAEVEMVEQLFTMVVAGHETTATALAWCVDELFRHPAWVARLREELAPTHGEPEKLAACASLEAVCAEVLRLRPLIPMVSRRCLVPFRLGDWELPAGTGVAPCLALAHMDPALHADPTTFRPERFLQGTALPPAEYLPFGGGSRRCLGAAFAMHEMKLVLGTLLLETELTLVSPTRARPSVRAATVGPRGGVKVVRTR